MSDTMRFSKTQLLVLVVTAVFVINGFPVRFSGNSRIKASATHVLPEPIAIPPAPSPAALVPQSTPNYDLCLQDNSNGSNLSLNTTTGEYIFTCGNCVKKSGVGALTVKGCTLTLQHNPSDRRVIATIDKCQRKGTASKSDRSHVVL